MAIPDARAPEAYTTRRQVGAARGRRAAAPCGRFHRRAAAGSGPRDGEPAGPAPVGGVAPRLPLVSRPAGRGRASSSARTTCVRAPDHRVALDAEARTLGARVERLLVDGGFTPPDVRQLEAATGAVRRELLDVLGVLEGEGRVRPHRARPLLRRRAPPRRRSRLVETHCRAHGEHHGRDVPRSDRREPQVRDRVPRLVRPDRRHAARRRSPEAPALAGAVARAPAWPPAPGPRSWLDRVQHPASVPRADAPAEPTASPSGSPTARAPRDAPASSVRRTCRASFARSRRWCTRICWSARDVRRRRRLPPRARSGARADRRLLLAHRRRPVPVRRDRRGERALRRLRHGRRAAHGAQHRVLPAAGRALRGARRRSSRAASRRRRRRAWSSSAGTR